MVGLAYLISYIGLTWHMKNNALELEEALIDPDEQQAEVLHLQLKRKRRHKMIMLIIAALGLFLFVVFLIIYFEKRVIVGIKSSNPLFGILFLNILGCKIIEL